MKAIPALLLLRVLALTTRAQQAAADGWISTPAPRRSATRPAQRRLGLRGEFVTGNTPSTLLSIEPEFAPAFRAGAHSQEATSSLTTG
jgi:hypothetical protein